MRFTAWTLAALAAASLTLAASAAGADLAAKFSWNPQQPRVGQEVTFTSTSTGDPDSYAWDLDGDGEYDDATGPVAKRTYDQAGNKTVRLEVKKGDTTSQDSHTFRVASGLQSSFTWSPQSPTTADQVAFTSTSTLQGATITNYSWDLNGDRKFDDATGASVPYNFAEAGDHQVGLRVTDNTGTRATSFNTVAVASPPPPPPPPAAEPAPPAAQQWLNPFPSVRIRGRATRGGVHLSLLAVRAPIGSALKLRCKGKRCPKKSTRRYTFTTERLRLRGMERFLTAGTKVELFIWKSGLVGKYTRFDMRRAKPPVRVDRCLYPGGRWPGRCPS
jgi:hypothetical protein